MCVSVRVTVNVTVPRSHAVAVAGRGDADVGGGVARQLRAVQPRALQEARRAWCVHAIILVACIYTHTHTHVHTRTRTYIHIHTYLRTRTHIRTLSAIYLSLIYYQIYVMYWTNM